MYGTPTCLAKQDVLSCLGHGTISSTHNQDSPVHLGCSCDHVLDVVSMPRAVNVGVVAICSSVLLVGGGYCDAPLTLFWGVVYLVESHLSVGGIVRDLLGKHPGYGRGQGGLAMVDVTDGADVEVWLGALEPAS